MFSSALWVLTATAHGETFPCTPGEEVSFEVDADTGFDHCELSIDAGYDYEEMDVEITGQSISLLCSSCVSPDAETEFHGLYVVCSTPENHQQWNFYELEIECVHELSTTSSCGCSSASAAPRLFMIGMALFVFGRRRERAPYFVTVRAKSKSAFSS